MSIWSRLFGGGSREASAPTPMGEIEHGGFTIVAEPYRAENGQFQTAGRVWKVVDGTVREHRFVRADRFATAEDAAAFALSKGRQLVDQQGDSLFA